MKDKLQIIMPYNDEGKKVTARFNMTTGAYAGVISYLARLNPERVVEVRPNENGCKYVLKNGGNVVTAKDDFGGIEISVLNCPEDIYSGLKNVLDQDRKEN